MSGILTQVVDGNWTDHAVIKAGLLAGAAA
jgi:hypothetical protein